MGDIGYIALFLALLAALFSAAAYITGGRGQSASLLSTARKGLIGVFALVSVATLVLLVALLTHNYRIEYVAYYSNSETAVPYLISGLWAGNKGSLLFWSWVLSLFALVAAIRIPDRGRKSVAFSWGIVMLIEAFFIFLVLAIANPFAQLNFMPQDGMGLNPMLENPGMVIHPPALLAGYVGLAIPFALAIGALLARETDNEWLGMVRRWTLLPWLLLGAGNIIGAWWAYVELGWGGYWAWDPVENAGLMPWLAATALIHSLMVQRRKGMFKVWNMVLVTVAFNLAIFGTFLTRSNMLSSVHTFGDTGLEGPFITFLVIAFFGALALIFMRREYLKSEGEVEKLVSREGAFLLNNLLLTGSALIVLAGTIFPAISGAVSGTKVEVGAGFFNTVNGPILLGIILLAGICTLLRWQGSVERSLGRSFVVPGVVAAVAAGGMVAGGVRQPVVVFSLALLGLVLGAIAQKWVRDVGSHRREIAEGQTEGWLAACGRLFSGNRPRYGGYIVHIGMVLMALGVIGSSFYGTEQDVVMKKGESVTISNYVLTYENLTHTESTSKLTFRADLAVSNAGGFLARVAPEKYLHANYEQPVSEVSIRSTLLEDLYVVLLDWGMDGSARFKIMVNPLVSWIWVGGTVLVLGGLIAFLPDRRKVPARRAVKIKKNVRAAG